MNTPSPLPRITLVGAGPGDPELISLKGVKALQRADVVLYDALVHPELLEYVPAYAERIFVGKRAGQHSFKQDEINRLLVHQALARGHVVRLKGGDPFVFGRGHEELAYARQFGVPVSVVPGISSLSAVPGLQQIPLTCRGINESVWVVTGTTAAGKLAAEMEQAARSTATVVVLMGLRKLGEIAALYQRLGRGELPATVIQSGSLPEEKVALGPIGELPEIVAEARIGGPALIVIGPVVALHPQYPAAQAASNQKTAVA